MPPAWLIRGARTRGLPCRERCDQGGGCLSQHEAPVVLLHLQLNLCRVQLPVHPQDGESPGDAVLSLQTGGGRYPGHQRSRLLVEARDLRAHRKSRITNQRQSTSGVTRRMDWG